MAGIFDPGIFDSGIFDVAGGGTGSFTADAVLRKTQTPTFTANAVFRQGFSGSFTADAIIVSRTPLVLQSGAGVSAVAPWDISLPANPTNGHTLLNFQGRRGNSGMGFTGYTTGPDGSRVAFNGDALQWQYKTASGDTTPLTSGDGDSAVCWVELDRQVVIDAHAETDGGSTQSSTPSISLTVGDKAIVFAIFIEGTDGGWGNQTFTPPSGWTELMDLRDPTDHPSVWVGYRLGPTGGGSVTANPTCTGSGYWAAQIVSFVAVTREATFNADSVLRKTQSASFTADAFIRGRQFTADALIRLITTRLLPANAVIRKGRTGSFTADAVLGTFARVTSSFTANAVVRSTPTDFFTANAWIKNGSTGETGEPGIHIKVDGLDITKDVLLSDAEFTMLSNGAVGNFRCRVRDDGHTYDFTSGAEVTVDIDGMRKFGGYALMPARAFFFDFDDTTDPTIVERYWVLEGVDYNILFGKRIVYDKNNPANILLRSWPAGSRDDDVIKYVVNHNTDLLADGVTTEGVTHVGSPNPDRAGVVGSGSFMFGQVMQDINALIDAVYYFDPYKRLCFVDVETVDAPVNFSDHPTTGEISYREFRNMESGAKMVNDAFIWGAAAGAAHLAYARVTDQPSIDAHGLWQYGEFTSQLYRQTSVEKRADSIVNGSPQSKRGGKDDQVSWMLATFDKRFRVGMKAQIESEVWGISDVVPIRRMTLKFEEGHPKFYFTLSHEIDEPWNLFEFFPFQPIPPVNIPQIKPPTFDQNSTHAYFGTFTFAVQAAHGGGWANAGPPDGTLNPLILFSSNETPYPITPGEQFVGAMGIIAAGEGPNSYADYAPDMGFTDLSAGTLNIRPIQTRPINGINGVFGWGGTFTYSPSGGPTSVWAAASIAKGGDKPFTPGGSDHTANVTWWIDPVGWTPTNTPSPGQQILNDFQILDGTSTHYFTANPYVPGTLVVTINGTEVPITEIDPATGEFALTSVYQAGWVLAATYTMAGSFNYFGPVIEAAQRIDSTHYQLSSQMVPGTSQVWATRLFQIPGTDYTEDPTAGQIVFASAQPVDAVVWVNYFANGAI